MSTATDVQTAPAPAIAPAASGDGQAGAVPEPRVNAGMTAAEKRERREPLREVIELFGRAVDEGKIDAGAAQEPAQDFIRLAGMVDLDPPESLEALAEGEMESEGPREEASALDLPEPEHFTGIGRYTKDEWSTARTALMQETPAWSKMRERLDRQSTKIRKGDLEGRDIDNGMGEMAPQSVSYALRDRVYSAIDRKHGGKETRRPETLREVWVETMLPAIEQGHRYADAIETDWLFDPASDPQEAVDNILARNLGPFKRGLIKKILSRHHGISFRGRRERGDMLSPWGLYEILRGDKTIEDYREAERERDQDRREQYTDSLRRTVGDLEKIYDTFRRYVARGYATDHLPTVSRYAGELSGGQVVVERPETSRQYGEAIVKRTTEERPRGGRRFFAPVKGPRESVDSLFYLIGHLYRAVQADDDLLTSDKPNLKISRLEDQVHAKVEEDTEAGASLEKLYGLEEGEDASDDGPPATGEERDSVALNVPCPRALHAPLETVVNAARDVRALQAAYEDGGELHGMTLTPERVAVRMGRHALNIVRAGDEMRTVELDESEDAADLNTADCLDYAERAAPGLRSVLDAASGLLALHEDDDGNAPDAFSMPAAGKEEAEERAEDLADAARAMLTALEQGPPADEEDATTAAAREGGADGALRGYEAATVEELEDLVATFSTDDAEIHPYAIEADAYLYRSDNRPTWPGFELESVEYEYVHNGGGSFIIETDRLLRRDEARSYELRPFGARTKAALTSLVFDALGEDLPFVAVDANIERAAIVEESGLPGVQFAGRFFVEGRELTGSAFQSFESALQDVARREWVTRYVGADYVEGVVEKLGVEEEYAAGDAGEHMQQQVSGKEAEEDAAPSEWGQSVIQIPLDDLHTDEQRFQPRGDAFSEETARRVAENFDPQLFEPIRTWQDPENGEWYVLAGHSRLAGMRRRDAETIPARPFEGSEEEAIRFALTENDKGTALTNDERAAYIRRLREQGRSKKEQKEEAKRLYGRDAATVIALSYLNPEGKALDVLRRFSGNATGEANDAETMAVWIGKLRRYHENLTGSHENEIYNWLAGNYKSEGLRITSFIEFRERVEEYIRRRSTFGEIEGPLNFADVPAKSRQEEEIDRQLAEARQDLKRARRERNQVEEKYAGQDLTPEEWDRVVGPANEDVQIAQDRVLEMERRALDGKHQLARSEMSLFDALRANPADLPAGWPKIEPCAIVTENEGKGGIELRFPEDPGEEVLEVVRDAGFFFYTPTDAPPFWAATANDERRALACALDKSGDFCTRENPSIGALAYLGRVEIIDTTAGIYGPRPGEELDLLFTTAEGDALLVVPDRFAEEIPADDARGDGAAALFERWSGYDAGATDFRIELPDAELIPAGTAERIVYHSDKLARPGDRRGLAHRYRHNFDAGQRPATLYGPCLYIGNVEVSQRGILN